MPRSTELRAGSDRAFGSGFQQRTQRFSGRELRGAQITWRSKNTHSSNINAQIHDNVRSAIASIESSTVLQALVRLQNFIGSWPWGPELLCAVGLTKSPLSDVGLDKTERFVDTIHRTGLATNLDGVATVLALRSFKSRPPARDKPGS